MVTAIAMDHSQTINPVEDGDVIPRRETRRPVSMTGFGLLPDRSTFGVTLLDLSYDGCRVATDVVLEPGVRFRLSVSGLGALSAQVRWYDGGRAGLLFGDDFAADSRKVPRVEDRLEIRAVISLRREGRNPYTTVIHDLSPTGYRVAFVELPRVGERVWAKFEGLESLEGEVCWVEGFNGGVQLKRAMHPAVFDLLVSRLAGAKSR